eukprot:15268268-Alexandrium_andersonii.AAC.1
MCIRDRVKSLDREQPQLCRKPAIRPSRGPWASTGGLPQAPSCVRREASLRPRREEIRPAFAESKGPLSEAALLMAKYL